MQTIFTCKNNMKLSSIAKSVFWLIVLLVVVALLFKFVKFGTYLAVGLLIILVLWYFLHSSSKDDDQEKYNSGIATNWLIPGTYPSPR